MTDDQRDLQRLLGSAFDAQARSAVPDGVAPPAPRFRQPDVQQPPRRRFSARVVAPLAAAVAVAASVTVVVAVTRTADQPRTAGRPVGATTSEGRTSTAVVNPTPSTISAIPNADRAQRGAAAVHLTSIDANQTYGVAMPVVVRFSKRITDAHAFAAATTVLVDGRPTTAAWYFEASMADAGRIEAHLRPQDYWPAHAFVHVSVAAKGLSAGRGLGYANDLSIVFATGARTIATVDARTDTLTVTSDGKRVGHYPVSLGAARTPTSSGIKVVMEKGGPLCMHGAGYNECGIKYTQRLTYDGEYLHAAPWNVGNIIKGISTSNGCTNLLPADAAKLYAELRVGDPVEYPNSNGPKMTLGAGFGDWNLSWSQWLTGGLLSTR